MTHIVTDNPLIQIRLWWYDFWWQNWYWAIIIVAIFILIKNKKDKRK